MNFKGGLIDWDAVAKALPIRFVDEKKDGVYVISEIGKKIDRKYKLNSKEDIIEGFRKKEKEYMMMKELVTANKKETNSLFKLFSILDNEGKDILVNTVKLFKPFSKER